MYFVALKIYNTMGRGVGFETPFETIVEQIQ